MTLVFFYKNITLSSYRSTPLWPGGLSSQVQSVHLSYRPENRQRVKFLSLFGPIGLSLVCIRVDSTSERVPIQQLQGFFDCCFCFFALFFVFGRSCHTVTCSHQQMAELNHVFNEFVGRRLSSASGGRGPVRPADTLLCKMCIWSCVIILQYWSLCVLKSACETFSCRVCACVSNSIYLFLNVIVGLWLQKYFLFILNNLFCFVFFLSQHTR